MRIADAVLLLVSACLCAPNAPAQVTGVPPQCPDWLIAPGTYRASLVSEDSGKAIRMQNGLLSRALRLKPNAATVDIRNLVTGEEYVRAVRPEALLRINGKTVAVGGLSGQVEQGYLLESWLDALKSDTAAFQFAGYESGPTAAPFPYRKKRWGPDAPWPPPGKSLTLRFRHASPALAGIDVAVHYEMYDGIPLVCKWIEVHNGGTVPFRLNAFTSEMLALVEPHWSLDAPGIWDRYNIHVESDYAFFGMTVAQANKTAYWTTDSSFTSQVHYELGTPCLLECRPPLGPDVDVAAGETFTSFRTFELFYDSSEQERRSLELRRMYRVVAPWAMENPIFLHLTSIEPDIVRRAVDQCVEAGFEMIILSFGSGVNMETDDDSTIARMKALADYAHSRGIELGGYSLLASRHISPADDVINPATGHTGGALFGDSPCLGSRWGIAYFRNLRAFIERTGFDILEHDGSYPGDICASASHPGHRGRDDSQWRQWKTVTDFYKWCRGRDIYLNVPDWYFLSGSNKTAIGYRETNWSLPRDRQILLGRQNIFDGTWYKTPSMGWTFVPLVEYQGGGAAATLEPLADHLDAYQAHMAQNFGSGVQACYRGFRLYDAETTRAAVRQWTDWYKAHREILNSDIIHMHRPDGRTLDCMLHVNPALPEKGLLMIYNPLTRPVTETLTVPLYYTGLTGSARIRREAGDARTFALDAYGRTEITVTVQPQGRTWYTIE